MDMQWGADGSFYLLTYGDGFFAVNPDAGLYRWDYVKGQRAPKAVLTTDKTDGAAAADRPVLERGLERRGRRATRSRYEWDFGDGSRDSTEPEPDATSTPRRGRYTAVLTVIDSSGQERRRRAR